MALEECTRPARLFSDDYRDLCPLSNPERVALDFELPGMVRATFYTILLNDAAELGIVSGPIAVDLKLTLEGLRWASFTAWLGRNKGGLMVAQLHQRTPPEGARGLVGGQEES